MIVVEFKRKRNRQTSNKVNVMGVLPMIGPNPKLAMPLKNILSPTAAGIFCNEQWSDIQRLWYTAASPLNVPSTKSAIHRPTMST